MSDHTTTPTRQFAVDERTMIIRATRLSSRNVEAMIMALALPLMLMLMFVYLFGGAIDTEGRYVDYVVPGVLLVCVAFGAGTTAASVAADLHGGIIDRFRSMDVRGEALLLGQVVASVARNLLATAVVFVAAFAIGFRSHVGMRSWLAAIGLLALFVFALSCLAAAIGVLAGSPEAANGATFLVTFLPYASSAFVPIETMPSWLRGFAQHQPVTSVIDSIRALLSGDHVGTAPAVAAAWSVGIIVVSVATGGALFRRRTAG